MMFTPKQVASLVSITSSQGDLIASGVSLAAIDRAVRVGAIRRFGVQAGGGSRIELARI